MTRIQLLTEAIAQAGGQQALARILGIAQSTVTKWHNSPEKSAKISRQHLTKLCEIANVNPSEVVGTIGELECANNVLRGKLELVLSQLAEAQKKLTDAERENAVLRARRETDEPPARENLLRKRPAKG